MTDGELTCPDCCQPISGGMCQCLREDADRMNAAITPGWTGPERRKANLLSAETARKPDNSELVSGSPEWCTELRRLADECDKLGLPDIASMLRSQEFSAP